LIIDSETVKMKSSYLVVKVNLRDATKGQAAVAKAKNSEVDSKDIAGAKGDKKMMAMVPQKKGVEKVDKNLVAKAPKKKSLFRKKREEDLAKHVTKSNAWKKTVVLLCPTIALGPDKLAMVLVPVQLDNEGTAMQSKNFNDYSKCKQLM
jgi:hypothetical protein